MVRSLSEAPRYASVISDILRNRVYPGQYLPGTSQSSSPSMLGKLTQAHQYYKLEYIASDEGSILV